MFYLPLAALLVCSAGLTHGSASGDKPGPLLKGEQIAYGKFSGLTKAAGSTFLAVRDLKSYQSGHRLALLTIMSEAQTKARRKATKKKISPVVEIDVPMVYPAGQNHGPLNDLEACCTLPGRKDEFLLAESMYYNGMFGRVLHIKLKTTKDPGGADVTKAHYLGHFEPFPGHGSGKKGYETPKHLRVEGMEAFAVGSTTHVVFGLRGDANSDATMVHGTLTFSAAGSATGFTERGRRGLSMAPTDHDRGCAAYHLCQKPGEKVWQLWVVATHDHTDVGPFRSVVYPAVEFSVGAAGQVRQRKLPPGNPLWRVRGLKVEGLAAAADVIGNSAASIVSECEFYGGVWRPLELISAERAAITGERATPFLSAAAD